MLEVRNVSKSFERPQGKTTEVMLALQNVSFKLEQGGFYCLIGPSGCGKSTLLRIIHGLLRRDSGQVLWDGVEITKPELKRGMVFQGFNLLPWRTAQGNVEFALENMHLSRAEREQRARDYLELVGLQGFERYYPAHLSGGMQQRVGLARALAIEPEILLMDEPFGALDAQTRENLQNELTRIWSAHQRTVLFVTHDIEEACFLSDRVLVMSHRPGCITAEIEMPFARPREDTLRNTAAFAEMRGKVASVLKALPEPQQP